MGWGEVGRGRVEKGDGKGGGDSGRGRGDGGVDLVGGGEGRGEVREEDGEKGGG